MLPLTAAGGFFVLAYSSKIARSPKAVLLMWELDTLASLANGVRGGGPLSVFLSNVARLVCRRGEMDLASRATPVASLHWVIPDTLSQVLVPVFPPGGGALPPFGQYGYYAACSRLDNRGSSGDDDDRVCGMAEFLLFPRGLRGEKAPVSPLSLTATFTESKHNQASCTGTPPKCLVIVERKKNGCFGTDLFFQEVMERVTPDVNLLIVVTPKVPSRGYFISRRQQQQQTSEDKQLVKQGGKAEKTLDELFVDLCAKCQHNHNAFQDAANKLRIVAVRDVYRNVTTKYVKVAGKEQKGDSSAITLMVVMFVVPIDDEAAEEEEDEGDEEEEEEDPLTPKVGTGGAQPPVFS